MIVAKPKVSTLFSLGIFIVISLALSGYSVVHIISGKPVEWYHYALGLIFLPIGLGLLVRMLFGYRVVTIGKGKFDIHFPSRFNHKSYKVKDVTKWKETQVKTISGTFKELEIYFNDNKHITLSVQEHTDYPKVLQYMKKKCSKLRVDA